MKTKELIDGSKVSWETRTRNTNKGYILLTKAEIKAEDKRISDGEKAEKEYQEKFGHVEPRKAEYPDTGDQLDEIMKWLSTEKEITIPTKLKSIAMKCMSVKSKYPKSNKE